MGLSTESQLGQDSGDQIAASKRSPIQPQQGPWTWTNSLPATEIVDLFRRTDFSSTSLGSFENWCLPLRLYVAMVFADHRASIVFWGPHYVCVYNEPYVPMIGKMHPFLMGKSFESGFPEAWDQISSIFQTVFATREAVSVKDIHFSLERNQYLEESYFDGLFIPVQGMNGEVEGIYHTVRETTQEVLRERYRVVADLISDIPPSSISDFLTQASEALETNLLDIPMVLLYTYDEFSSPCTPDLHLRGSVGIPVGHHSAPLEARLTMDKNGIIPLLKMAKELPRPTVLRSQDETFQTTMRLFEDIPWRGHGEPPSAIVISPLMVRGSIQGFFVQGTNPRRQFDESTQRCITDLARRIELAWGACISAEEEQMRKLALEQRASDSENRLRHMASHAPLGMCQVNLNHQIEWANDQFYEIIGIDNSVTHMGELFDAFDTEHKTLANTTLDTATCLGTPATQEYRLLRTYIPTGDSVTPDERHIWILASIYPLMENGTSTMVMYYVSDISSQKRAESIEHRSATQALEAKRRQEEFIDTTFHELRNPLSAITQLAEGISSSASRLHETLVECSAIIAEHAEAADVLTLCAAHQKTVIDDILTMSRLDSGMLALDLAPHQPKCIVQNAVKMFEGTATASGIDLMVTEHQSIKISNVDYLSLDGSRILQILINFLTNSIKFTALQQSDKRMISLTYGVQSHLPIDQAGNYGTMKWAFPLECPRAKNDSTPPESSSNKVYLYFRVEDTGNGMTPEETGRLFQRWAQAKPRTQTTYGGSGLGLYISRQIAARHGGDVGVSSRYGEGSCFAFYVAADRADYTLPESPNHQASGTSTQHQSISQASQPTQPQLAHRSKDDTGPKRQADEQRKTDGPSPKDLNILLVEDNIVNQKVLSQQLRKAGCTVATANHGVEALEVLKTSSCWATPDAGTTTTIPIDIVLMDWEMPVMDGLECCRQIRQLEESGQIKKHLHVIAVTANVRQEQKDKAMEAGMDDVVSKPCAVRDLLAKMLQATPGPN